MSEKQINKTSSVSLGLIAVLIVFLGAAVYVIKIVLADDGQRKKSSIAIVTLLKPPPPPQIKEKPPEPEQVKMQKKEDIIDPLQQVDKDNKPAGEPDNAPAGDKLGLDAEGSAGGDAFGLVGKKGGRSLIAGGGGNGGGMGRLSLLTKFAGYSHIVEAEIRKKVIKRLDEYGGIPKGKLQAVARISLDSSGSVKGYKIIGSSGNHKMDEAVELSLAEIKISEPPPDGMPRTMTIKISSQG